MRRTSVGEWLKILGIALVAAILLTRIPIILALGRPERKQMPAACLEGPGAVRGALARAPQPVRVDGARISDCFPRSSSTSDVQTLGGTLLAVASDLSAKAQADPEGPAALRLGYLIGAVRRGASATQGIYANLVQRVQQEGAAVEGTSGAYRAGERAGHRTG